MKYIKTKDGIFEVIKENDKFVTVKFPFTGGVQIHKEMITSQANHIEDLCDKFVIHTTVGIWIRRSWDSAKETISAYKKVLREFIKNVYGAIWTEKGLTYVAKINEKGEWELL